jgi:uncharacterized protein (DUF1330 family)
MKMKIGLAVSATVLTCVVVGAVAIQELRAQAKPPVYVVNEVEIIDQSGFQAYAAAQQKIIEKHGGKYVIRGGKVLATLSGSAPAGRYTVYRFENQDKMQAWRDDPAQKDGLATRDKVAKFRSFVVEGLPN